MSFVKTAEQRIYSSANRVVDRGPISEQEPKHVKEPLVVLDLLWRSRNLIAGLCAVSMIAAVTVKLMDGPSHSATVVILPALRAIESGNSTGPNLALDARMVMEGEVQLIKSHAVARQLAQRLAATTGPAILPRASDAASALDNAPTSELMDKLVVNYHRQTYLISVSYMHHSANTARMIVNGLASEFIRFKQLKTLASRYSGAKERLAVLLLSFGDKHPAVIRARTDAELAFTAMREAEETAHLMTERELSDTGLVVPAHVVTIPATVGITSWLAVGLFGGMLLSIAIILFREPKAGINIVREALRGPN